MKIAKIGEWAFIAGVIIAVLLGLLRNMITLTIAQIMAVILVVLGIIVGVFNISKKEAIGFLVAAIALVAVQSAGFQFLPYVGAYLADMLAYLALFIAPAAVIVAVKSIITLGKRK